MARICSVCGCEYNKNEARNYFEAHFNYDLYYSDVQEPMCGSCAVEYMESRIYWGPDEDDDEDDSEIYNRP